MATEEKLLQDLLNELEIQIKLKNPFFLNSLNQGINNFIINSLINGLGIELPPEVFQLYNWKNGTNMDGEFYLGAKWLFRGGVFTSIERSIEAYQYYSGKDEYWKKTMFMLFESGGGEMFIMDCNKESKTFGFIYKHSIGAIDYDVAITAYDSLYSWLKTILECYKKNIYHFDNSSILEFDFQAEAFISKKYNPKSKLWKLFG